MRIINFEVKFWIIHNILNLKLVFFLSRRIHKSKIWTFQLLILFFLDTYRVIIEYGQLKNWYNLKTIIITTNANIYNIKLFQLLIGIIIFPLIVFAGAFHLPLSKLRNLGSHYTGCSKKNIYRISNVNKSFTISHMNVVDVSKLA